MHATNTESRVDANVVGVYIIVKLKTEFVLHNVFV